MEKQDNQINIEELLKFDRIKRYHNLRYDIRNHIHHLKGFDVKELKSILLIKNITFTEKTSTLINLELGKIALSDESKEYIKKSIIYYLRNYSRIFTNKIITNPEFYFEKKIDDITVNVSFFLQEDDLESDILETVSKEKLKENIQKIDDFNQLLQDINQLRGGFNIFQTGGVQHCDVPDRSKIGAGVFYSEPTIDYIEDIVGNIIAAYITTIPNNRASFDALYDLLHANFRTSYLDSDRDYFFGIFSGDIQLFIRDLLSVLPKKQLTKVRNVIPTLTYQNIRYHIHNAFVEDRRAYNDDNTALTTEMGMIRAVRLLTHPLSPEFADLTRELHQLQDIFRDNQREINYLQLVINGGIASGFSVNPFPPPAAAVIGPVPVPAVLPAPGGAAAAAGPAAIPLPPANINSTAAIQHIIDANLTNATFMADTWRIEILRDHIHGLNFAHNGLANALTGAQVIEELNLHTTPLNLEKGYQFIHTYLHILDEIPLLNFADPDADSRHNEIVNELRRMRASYHDDLIQCIERLLNSERSTAFERDPVTGQFYTPYKLVNGSYQDKYRQMNRFTPAQIRPEFQNACLVNNAPHVPHNPADPTTAVYPNTAEITARGLPPYI